MKRGALRAQGFQRTVLTETLDLYGHLFPDQLDEVARLDAAARAVGYLMCTRAEIIPMSLG